MYWKLGAQRDSALTRFEQSMNVRSENAAKFWRMSRMGFTMYKGKPFGYFGGDDMRLDAARVYIRRLTQDDIPALLSLRLQNREFLRPFEPIMPDSHYTLAGQQEFLSNLQQNWDNRSGYGLGIFLISTHQLIGRVALSNVVHGAWESCTIGYFMDQNFNGLGLMTEAVRLAIHFAFEFASLHRVQAAVMPRNIASIRVLEKVGFRYDGFSEYYLKINGIWEHHNLYSLTRERWHA